MIRKYLKSGAGISMAALLGLGLTGLSHVYGDDTEDVPVVSGMDAVGLVVAFDTNGNNVHKYKIGNTEVTATLKKDGTVGLKVTKGTLTLSAPTGEPLATLTEGDDIELSGFLDTSKMFELLHGNDSQMLRLGAIAAVSISNVGPKPVKFTVGGVGLLVGAKTGRQDAAIGKIYHGPLPKNILTLLKPGQSVVGLDGDGKPIVITRDRQTGKPDQRKSIDDKTYADLEKRAGLALLDRRKVVPILGVTIRVVLDKTTFEITGTADGAIIRVIDGESLKLGTANKQFVGTLPLHAEIQISGLTLKNGAFYTPIDGSLLMLPVTSSYIITNLSDTELTLGKVGELIKLAKNEKMTGNKSGYVTVNGVNPDDLKNLPAGTGVLVTNANGESVLVIVGDPLSLEKSAVSVFTIINITSATITIDLFNIGSIVTGPGSGVTIPTTQFTLAVQGGSFVASIPAGTFNSLSNAGEGNTIILWRIEKTVIYLQGNNNVSQANEQKGENTNTTAFAVFVLGGNVPPLVTTMLNSLLGGDAGGGGIIVTTGTNNKKRNAMLFLTSTKGGAVVIPIIFFVDKGVIYVGSVPSATP